MFESNSTPHNEKEGKHFLTLKEKEKKWKRAGKLRYKTKTMKNRRQPHNN
jgi:hypothetical protein